MWVKAWAGSAGRVCLAAQAKGSGNLGLKQALIRELTEGSDEIGAFFCL